MDVTNQCICINLRRTAQMATTREIAANHASLLSHPAVVAELILTAAQAAVTA